MSLLYKYTQQADVNSRVFLVGFQKHNLHKLRSLVRYLLFYIIHRVSEEMSYSCTTILLKEDLPSWTDVVRFLHH